MFMSSTLEAWERITQKIYIPSKIQDMVGERDGESVGGRNGDATRQEKEGHEHMSKELFNFGRFFNSLVGSHQHGEFRWLL